MHYIIMLLAALALGACGGGGGGGNTTTTPPAPPANNAPVATGVSGLTTSDIATVSGTISASDADGDSLTFAVSTAPAKGTITSLNTSTGEFVYTPDPTQDGPDSFAVTASDAFETSAPAVVGIEIFDWVGTQQFGTTANDILATGGLIILPDGGQIQAGLTFGEVASTPNLGQSDIFVRTVDRRGNETSISQFGSTSFDTPRGLYPRPQGDGYYVLQSGFNFNIYRFDNAGMEVFRAPLPVSGDEELMSLVYWSAVNADGDIFTISRRETVISSDPWRSVFSGVISKVSGADGSLIWQRDLWTPDEDAVNYFINDTGRIFPRGIDLDSMGNIVISGEFDDSSGSRSCETCGFVAKLAADDGADMWVRETDVFTSCGDDGSGRFMRVAVAEDDSIYVNGHSNVDFSIGNDGLLAKFAADGSQRLWSFCEDTGSEVVRYFTNPLLTSDGGVINYGNTVTTPPIPADGSFVAASDLLVRKFDADGNDLWLTRIEATRFDGSDAYQGAGGIAEDSQGILYITGFTDGNLTEAGNNGEDDAFVIRLGPDGSVQ